MAITTTKANAVLASLFGSGSPATYYIGLGISGSVPVEAGTGYLEPTGGAYARVALTNSVGNWTTASARAILTNTGITFTESSASWGTIRYILIFGSASGSDLLFYNTLSADKTISSDTIVSFPAGNITISIDSAV